MKKILIISYHFPPGINSQAQHVENVVDFLSKKYDITLLSSLSGRNKEMASNNLDWHIEYVPSGILHQAYHGTDNSNKNNQNESNSKFLNFKYFKARTSNTLKKHLMPDTVIDWRKKAIKSGHSLLKRNQFDLIISFATPYTDLLVGDHLSRKENIPHIVIMADPWYGENSVKRFWLRSLIEKKMQSNIFNHAKKIFFVTKKTTQFHEKIFPQYSQKYNYYYMGHRIAKEKKEIEINLSDNKISLYYFGAIQSAHRDPFPLLNALNDTKNDFNFEMYLVDHPSHKEIKNFVNAHSKLKSKIIFCKPVSYDLMLTKVRNSGLNIIFGNKNNIQIPGKVFDYIGQNSNILYLEQNPNSELNEIFKKYRNCYVVANTETEILKFLNSLPTLINDRLTTNSSRSTLYYENTYQVLNDSIREVIGSSE